jgi:hypothetical protein
MYVDGNFFTDSNPGAVAAVRSRSALMPVSSEADTIAAAKDQAAVHDIHVLEQKKVLLYLYLIIIIIIIIILRFRCIRLTISFAIRNQILLLPMLWVLLMKSRQEMVDLVLLLCMSLYQTPL